MAMRSRRRFARVGRALVAGLAGMLSIAACGSSGAAKPPAGSAAGADAALDRAIRRAVAVPGAPPAIVAVVQRNGRRALHTAGTGTVGRLVPPRLDDRVRLASVSKAFNGAAVLSAVADGRLALDDTITMRLPQLSGAWGPVTLAQLLGHTSGVPDFSREPRFLEALKASLSEAPPPAELLSSVEDEPLRFRPGTRYHYSNSDNVIAALMLEAVTGRSYAAVLTARVNRPLGLHDTSLPSGATIPTPFIHGYDVSGHGQPEDVSELFAAGWTWSSGGVVATPGDANRFVRGYVAGRTTDRATRAAQFRFRRGGSEPPGPGANAAGLAVFRYRTRCGTVYGHTGNTPGYTQFVAATRDGSRSVAVTANAQVTPTTDRAGFRRLRQVWTLAVCAALAHR